MPVALGDDARAQAATSKYRVTAGGSEPESSADCPSRTASSGGRRGAGAAERNWRPCALTIIPAIIDAHAEAAVLHEPVHPGPGGDCASASSSVFVSPEQGRRDEAARRRVHQAGEDADRADRVHDRRRRHRAHGRDEGRRVGSASAPSCTSRSMSTVALVIGLIVVTVLQARRRRRVRPGNCRRQFGCGLHDRVTAPEHGRFHSQRHSRHHRRRLRPRGRAAGAAVLGAVRSGAAAPRGEGPPTGRDHRDDVRRAVRCGGHRHAPGADRCLWGHGVHHRPIRPRFAARPRQVDGRRLPDLRVLHFHRAWRDCARQPGSA